MVVKNVMHNAAEKGKSDQARVETAWLGNTIPTVEVMQNVGMFIHQ